ncbi:MAG: hypothetical protein HQM00_15330, partial [Magnetococcales bacterium]|nr:hypothetical protein [Magnetococcales bacterium]
MAAYPDTGRTHQIRVHLQWLGHPVAGDEKYGDAALNQRLRHLGISRMCLHAHKIRFTHPATGTPLEIEAPLDEMFTRMSTLDSQEPASPSRVAHKAGSSTRQQLQEEEEERSQEFSWPDNTPDWCDEEEEEEEEEFGSCVRSWERDEEEIPHHKPEKERASTRFQPEARAQNRPARNTDSRQPARGGSEE